MTHSYPISRLLSLALLLLLPACGSAEVAVDRPLILYPDPPAAPRIQFLRTVAVGTDVESGRSSLDTLLFGEQELEKKLMAPYGVTLHEGVFYVCDIQQSMVVTIDLKGREFFFADLTGRGAVQKPVNIAFSEDGRMFVADLGRRQVVAYEPDRDFEYLEEIGPFGETSKVVDVEVSGDRLYFLDGGNAEVRVFDVNTFEELMVFGQEGEEAEGRLNKPTNLTIDQDGNVYVVDTVLCVVFVYSPDGQFLRTIGSPGDIVGQFSRPKGIAFADDILYVVDAAFENCQIFNLDGDPLMFFANAGVGPGNLYLPTSVWVGAEGEGLEMFRDDMSDDFHPERIIAITNLFGPNKLNFYAFGTVDGFDYAENEAARGLHEAAADPEDEG